VPIPASALERLVLPARVADYTPSYVDELLAAGDLVWAGAGAIGEHDGWVSLAFADSAPLLLPPPSEVEGPVHEAVLDILDGGQALFLRSIAERLAATGAAPSLPEKELVAVLWDLVWAGRLSNDTLAPLRAKLGGGGAHRARPSTPRTRYRRPGVGLTRMSLATARTGPPTAAGRWHRLPERDLDSTRRATATAESLLDRHGILTRGAVMAENLPGGFAGVYPVLAAMEERGAARRGYFVEGLGAAQFAIPGAVDRLRGGSEGHEAIVLAATDPANPYGAALPWPERVVDAGDGERAGHRAGRKAGALVVTVDGELALYVERGGRTLLSYVDEPEVLSRATKALADAVHAGALGAMSVERADGESIHASPLRDALSAAGFRPTPRGLRLRS